MHTRLAWAAGFFDGEGCISLIWKRRAQNTHAWWLLQVNLTNTDRQSLERFWRSIGQAGRIYAKKRVPNRRQIYYWVATDRAAERTLRLLRPYVFTKRPVSTLALEARRLGQRKPFERIPYGRWNRLVEIERAIKSLNGVNWQKRPVRLIDRRSPLVG